MSIRRKGYEVATNQELSNYEVSNQEAQNNEGQNEEVPNTELDASEDETMLMTSVRTTGSHQFQMTKVSILMNWLFKRISLGRRCL